MVTLLTPEYCVFPGNKIYGANMGPIWGRQDPGGPHIGPMNLAIWVILESYKDAVLQIHIYSCGRLMNLKTWSRHFTVPWDLLKMILITDWTGSDYWQYVKSSIDVPRLHCGLFNMINQMESVPLRILVWSHARMRSIGMVTSMWFRRSVWIKYAA